MDLTNPNLAGSFKDLDGIGEVALTFHPDSTLASRTRRFIIHGRTFSEPFAQWGVITDTFHPNGRLDIQSYKIDGLESGYQRKWSADGVLLENTCYHRGEKNEWQTIRRPNGTIERKTFWVKNLKDGFETIYCGDRRIESIYGGDVKNGEEIEWIGDQFVRRASYSNGKLDGTEKMWFSDGVAVEITHQNGVINGYEKIWYYDELVSYTATENGGITEDIVYEKPGSHGVVTLHMVGKTFVLYCCDGNPSSQETWIDGKMVALDCWSIFDHEVRRFRTQHGLSIYDGQREYYLCGKQVSATGWKRQIQKTAAVVHGSTKAPSKVCNLIARYADALL